MPPSDLTDPATSPASSSLYRYRFENVEFDESANELKLAGQAVQVERIPLRLLSELLRSPNEVVTRAELFESVWEGRPTVDHVLASAVNKLRKALGEEAAKRLVNVPRVGYRLDGPIERTAVGRQAVSTVPLLAGQRVPGRDGYVLECSLGSAPQAPVWLAREARLGEQRVFKFAADGERLSALKREYTLYRVLRQELGERQDFARIVGANFSTAPYFLECEYAGSDLRAWAAEGDRLANMSVTDRIALFLQIARAVMAAHGVGVLHKDLKPANVLVAPDGAGWVARLTDFGSARLLEPGRLAELGVTAMGLTLTQGINSGDMSGTPLYLAPELLAGQSPTTQSDLYSLGLMLYQLVVGDLRRPLVTGWQRYIEDDLLREDIIAATEGQPEDRLGSVAELVERLSTLSERRTGQAQRLQAAQRAADADMLLQRTRARRPWVGAAFGSLVLGLSASVWFYSQARISLRAAEQESARAGAVNEFLSKDVLRSADVVRAGANKPVLMLEVLKRASANAGERFKGQPELEAAVRQQLGKTFMRLASVNEAEAQLERAVELLAPSAHESDPLFLTVQLGYAEVLARRQDPEGKGVASAAQIVEQVERAAGSKLLAEKSKLAFLLAKGRFEVTLRREQLRGVLPVGKDSLPEGVRMLALADSVDGLDPEDRFEAQQSMAELYVASGQAEKAETLLKQVVGAPGADQSLGEVIYTRARMQLAEAYRLSGREAQAEAELLSIRDRLSRTLGIGSVQYGLAEHELARIYRARGDLGRTESAYRAALAAFTAALGEDHSYVKTTAMNLAAQVVEQEGRAAEALQIIDKLMPWFIERTSGGQSLWVAQYIRAWALTRLRRPAEALALLNSISVKDLEGRSFQWRIEEATGHALFALGRQSEGLAAWRAAVASAKRNPIDLEEMNDYRKLTAELAKAEARQSSQLIAAPATTKAE